MSMIFLSDGSALEIGVALSDLIVQLEAALASGVLLHALPRAESEGFHWINPSQIVRAARA